MTPLIGRGTTGQKPYTVDVSPAVARWDYSGLRVLELVAGQTVRLVTGPDEILVLPLAGSCRVSTGPHLFEIAGRPNVFAGPTDFCYLPRDTTAALTSVDGGRFALPAARAGVKLQPRYGPVVDVPVELRGAGSASRQVHNFCSPEVFPADRLIAVEVLTPGGNWSSYPPHKHDRQTPTESQLEEIYYFEVAGDGVGYQRVYASDRARPIDLLSEVRSGDVVLIPHGYHGPSMAAPGYDLYYLNVMAGPGERIWRFCDDPEHAWVRDTWADQAVDPRLPLSGDAT
jgi:5-deoxy-glucuronate isomerase